jgi:uncharacterized protein
VLIKELLQKNLIGKDVPSFIKDNTHYLALMGSVAYGCSTDYSDMDVYGWCIPPKEYIFPHLAGHIRGFGKEPQNFETWQKHHILDDQKKRSYDISMHGIVKYFQLITENNPNMIDSLFVSPNCVLHCSEAANMLRENRQLFLHKGCWHKFKGYAFSQLNKCKARDTEPILADILAFEEKHNLDHGENFDKNITTLIAYGAKAQDVMEYRQLYAEVETKKKRALNTKLFGFDVKFAYHVVRLVSEAEEILTDHTLTLDKYDRREILKDIRAGNWTFQQIRDYFVNKEKELDKLYQSSTLRHSPDESAIKQLLLNILESHYGNLEKAVVVSDNAALNNALQDISMTVAKYQNLINK